MRFYGQNFQNFPDSKFLINVNRYCWSTESQPLEAYEGYPAQLLLQCQDPLARISGMFDGEQLETVTCMKTMTNLALCMCARVCI